MPNQSKPRGDREDRFRQPDPGGPPGKKQRRKIRRNRARGGRRS